MVLGRGVKSGAVLGFGAVVLLGVAALAYLAYFQNKSAELNRQTLTLLGVGAGRLERRVENALRTAKNLATNPSYACKYLKRQTFLSLDRVGGKTTSDCERLKEDQKPLEPQASQARLCAVGRGLTIDVGENATCDDDEVHEKTEGFTLGLDLEPLLAELPLGEDFDQLLVLAADGDVAASRRRPQSGPGLEIRRLAEIRLTGEEGEEDEKNEEGEEPAAGKLRTAELKRVSNVEFAGTRYRLYCQPVEWSAGVTASEDIEWRLCGLIDEGRVRLEAMAIAPVGALALLTLFVVSGLAWPFLKVFSMSSRERLTLADTYFIYISLGSLLMLSMLLALLGEAYLYLGDDALESTEQLAEKVAENLHSEIVVMADRLKAHDDQLAASLNGNQMEEGAIKTWTDVLASGDHPFRAPDATDTDAEYPWFSSVFWAGLDDGLQVAKATPRGINTPQVEVRDRPYFKAVRDDELWTVGRHKLFVDVLRSITTGELQTAVALPSQIETSDQQRLAAVMIGPLLSATQPVLSLGHSFAVVDAEGRVQLSTDPRLALDEVLLDTVRDRKRLAEVLSSVGRSTRPDPPAHGASFATTYLKRPHFLAVEPVRDVPWAVVAFFDRQLLHTVLIESLCQAALLWGFYATIFFGAVPFFHFQVSKFWGLQHGWLWPDRQKKVLKVCLTAAFVVLAGFLLYSIIQHSPNRVLALSLLIPLLALVILALGHRFGRGQTAERDSKAFLRWAVPVFVLLWVVLAVLPAAAFFRLAFNEQRLRLVRLENLDFREDLKQRENAVDRDLREIKADIDLVKRRLGTDRDLYRTELWKGEIAGEGGKIRPQLGFLEPFLKPLMSRLPLYNPVVSRLRFLDDDEEWMKQGEVVWPRLHREMASRLPAWRKGAGKIGLLVSLVLLVLTALWSYWHTYHLYFGRVAFFERVDQPAISESAEKLAAGELPRLGDSTHLIALFTSPRTPAQFVKSETVYDNVDLLSDELDTVRKRMSGPPAKAPVAVLCTRLAVALEDPAKRAHTLDLLEWLVYERRQSVVVLSMLDPFELLFGLERRGQERPADPGAKQPESGSPASSGVSLSPQEARRWATLLSHFVMVPVPLPLADAAALAEADAVALAEADAVALAEADWIEPELWPLVKARHGDDVSKRLIREQRQSREALEGILEAAEGYYWALWNACSDDEKLVLVQLAQEKVLNPRQARTVRRLLQRGLLRRDPVLRPINESFALFVSRFHRSADVRRWERSFEGLGWRNIRWVLMAVLAILGLFLSATQRQQLEGVLGFIPALAAGLPAVLALLGGRGKSANAGAG